MANDLVVKAPEVEIIGPDQPINFQSAEDIAQQELKAKASDVKIKVDVKEWLLADEPDRNYFANWGAKWKNDKTGGGTVLG
jgi:hypothetical protein